MIDVSDNDSDVFFSISSSSYNSLYFFNDTTSVVLFKVAAVPRIEKVAERCSFRIVVLSTQCQL